MAPRKQVRQQVSIRTTKKKTEQVVWRAMTIAEREFRLRQRATPDEIKLRAALDADPRTEGRYEFQAHCVGYFADFLFRSRRLIVELDGSVHCSALAKLKDKRRTRKLNAAGYTVLRFWNSELRRPQDVVEKIANALQPPPVIVFK